MIKNIAVMHKNQILKFFFKLSEQHILDNLKYIVYIKNQIVHISNFSYYIRITNFIIIRLKEEIYIKENKNSKQKITFEFAEPIRKFS